MFNILLALFLSPAFGQTIGLDRFCGLSNSDSPATIADCESPDLLNVETNLTRTALKKRRGYTQEAALTYSSSPVSGATEFKCDNGDVLKVVCHDTLCAKSTNGGAFATFLTTTGAAANPVRWSFVSVDGDLYGANDQRSAVIKYDCTTLTRPSGIPAGSILAMTEDRLVVGDTSANPNRLNYSKSGAFTTFTAGSAAEDPFTDDLGAPGERTTGIVYNAGILWRWTPQSITACETGDQYTQRCSIFSPNIGTNDPASIVVANGSIYFKGSDNSDWTISPSGKLESISKKIKAFNQSLISGIARSNTQTTQNDWENGSLTPARSWNTASISGSVFPSSVTFTDTSGPDFGSATSSTTVSTYTFSGSLTLSLASGTFVNGGFQNYQDISAGNCAGTLDGTDWAIQVGNWRAGKCGAVSTLLTGPLDGTVTTFRTAQSNCSAGTPVVEVLNADSVLIASATISASAQTLTTFDLALSTEPYIRVRASKNSNETKILSRVFPKPRLFVFQTQISNSDYAGTSCGGGQDSMIFDMAEGYIYELSGSYVSKTFDTAFSTTIGGTFTVSLSSDTAYPATFQVQQSSDNIAFDSLASINNGAKIPLIRRYWRYKATFSTILSSQSAKIDSVSLIAATTGQITTQCIQPGIGITSWGTIACDFTTAGVGSVSIAIATATTCGGLSVYYAATNNATIGNGVGAAMAIRLTSLLGAATDQAQVNACTTYWNEGTVAQPVFGVFDPIANSIYWTATTTGATQGNRVKKYDLNLENSGVSPWFVHNISATAMGFMSNSLYFGSSGGGFWNKYGAEGINTDNGANINAYWKSRDFAGADPFVEKDWKYLSLIARNNVTGNFTTTYTDSFNKSTSYTVSLATSSTINYIRSTHAMTKRSPSNFLNVQIGNNSSTPFEVLGLRIDAYSQPWKAGQNP